MAARTRVNPYVISAGASDDSEDDLLTSSAQLQPTKRNNATKGKTMPARRVSTAATKRKAPAKTGGRHALKDRTNIHGASDTEEVENFDEEEGVKPKSKRAKTATTTTAKNARAAPAARGKAKTKASAQRGGAVVEDLSVIPETQQDPNDVSQSIELEQDEPMRDIPHFSRPTAPTFSRARSTSVQPLLPRASARSVSAQPPYIRERSGSVSDAATRERRGGDPETRRKLQDLTKRYENLSMKYQSLQSVGVEDAEGNFERLRRATAEKSKGLEELVGSLKKEIAELRKASAEVGGDGGKKEGEREKGLAKQLSTLTTSNDALSSEVTTLKSALTVAQNEHKSLEAKLVAARQQLSSSLATSEKDKPANSATTRGDLSRSVGASAISGTDAQKEAKMKENLYSDLTGLIIRGVKRKEGEDEYDCIQTGRNGTLHFHLSLAHPPNANTPNPKTPSGLSYEEAEFAYEPLLDDARDRELIEILPDYLTEEICFPRNHAVKFYTRVVECMTKRVVVEEE